MAESVVAPVGRDYRSLSEQAYGALLKAIVQRRILPGQRLVLDDLAEQLAVSRTPVRDALSRLASEGLVARHGRRGYCVTALTPDELVHLFDLRLMCELHAIEVGIANLSPGLLSAMTEAAGDIGRMHGSHDPHDKFIASLRDREFHRLLVSLAQNPRLTEWFELLNTHIHGQRVGPSGNAPHRSRALNGAEHFAILAALESGDVDAARASVRSHINNAIARALQMLDLAESESSAAAVDAVENGVPACVTSNPGDGRSPGNDSSELTDGTTSAGIRQAPRG